MRWLTFRDDSGERTGVLSGDGETIHPLAPGVSLLDLIGRGAAVLQEARERCAAVGVHRAARPGDADGADSAAAVDS